MKNLDSFLRHLRVRVFGAIVAIALTFLTRLYGLAAEPEGPAWTDGKTAIYTSDVIRAATAMDGMDDAGVIMEMVAKSRTNLYPVYLNIFKTSNDPRLVGRSLGILNEAPLYLAPERNRIIELFSMTNMLSQELFGALAAVALPGDERLVAHYLHESEVSLVMPAIKALRFMNTAESLSEIQIALPELEKKLTNIASARALNSIRVEVAEQFKRLSATYTRSDLPMVAGGTDVASPISGLAVSVNCSVALHQKLTAAYNQTTTTLGGETTRTSALTGSRATGLPGSDPAGQAASAEPASRLLRFALPVAFLALAAVVFWLIRRPRKS